MTVREVNSLTGEVTTRDYTQAELDAIAAYDETLPPETVPQISAMARLTIANGDISSITVSSKLAGGFRFDTGQYWIFFAESQSDTNYLALAYDSGQARAYVNDSDKYTDYFVVTVEDFDGIAVDPVSISLEIKRVA